jgi:hypothetical protein
MAGSIIPVRFPDAIVSGMFEKGIAFAGRIIDISALSNSVSQRRWIENGV